jgi:outer membrane lipoprotein LolB
MRQFLSSVICCFLVGCVSLQKQPPPLDGFLLKGKLAVEDAGDRHTANFQWRQEGDTFGIDVWGPLGQGRIHLEGNQQQLMLVDGQGEVIQQGPPAQVMQAALGWSLPLEVFTAWVLGAPDPALPATELVYGSAGHLESFRQAGWSVVFGQYREIAQAPVERWLPRKIDASTAATRIRLIIADWQI